MERVDTATLRADAQRELMHPVMRYTRSGEVDASILDWCISALDELDALRAESASRAQSDREQREATAALVAELEALRKLTGGGA